MRTKPVRSIEQHQAIIDAIAQGDATLARRHARDHRARDELVPFGCYSMPGRNVVLRQKMWNSGSVSVCRPINPCYLCPRFSSIE